MKLLKTYILILISTFCLFNCKKYPEGGCERRGPKNILGQWKLSLYEVNGIDSTELINYNGSDLYKKSTFLKHHYSDNDIIIQTEGSGTDKANFSSGNRKIIFYSNQQTSFNCDAGYCNKDYFIPEGNFQNEWEIFKLTKNEMILSCDLKNSYTLKFTQ